MKKYIITYWIRNVGENYSPFYEAIKLCFSDHTHPQENMWIVRCEYNANQITNMIKPFLKENDSLFVSEITSDMAGWMPKSAWEWLKTDDPSNVSANTNTDTKEYILCAAILRYEENNCPKIYWNNDIYKCELGYRHADILHRFKGIVKTDPDAQGFYTSKGRFVGRYEAFQIAHNAGQISDEVYNDRDGSGRLFSEDLY